MELKPLLVLVDFAIHILIATAKETNYKQYALMELYQNSISLGF
jgi:hypothetical protein